MNTKEASKIWNIKVEYIRDLCLFDVIPLAVKTKGRYEIPNDTVKPLENIKRVYYALYDLYLLDEGANPKRGIQDWEYQYLEDIGFVANNDKRTITSLGCSFMKKYEEKNNIRIKISGKIALRLGIVDIEVDAKTER